MAIESGLAQKASGFTGSMEVKPAPSIEKTPDETGQDSKNPQQGDQVTISEEARALSAPEKAGASGQTKEEKQDALIAQLKERIQKLEEEIKELEKSDDPEKEKQQKIQGKLDQLMQLRDQLLKAQQAELKAQGQASGGGTRANGAGNSVADF